MFDSESDFRRSTILLIAGACLMVLALTSWHRYLMARVPAPPAAEQRTDCPVVLPSVDAEGWPHRLLIARSRAAYVPPGAWQLPDGRIIGWSRQEDTTIYPHPGCY